MRTSFGSRSIAKKKTIKNLKIPLEELKFKPSLINILGFEFHEFVKTIRKSTWPMARALQRLANASKLLRKAVEQIVLNCSPTEINRNDFVRLIRLNKPLQLV